MPSRHLMVRSVQAEIATLQQDVYAAAMWDIGTFFESVEPAAMLSAVQKEGLPTAPAALALAGYASKRHLRIGANFDKSSTRPGRSIATGCHSATTLARAVLVRPTKAAHFASPTLQLTLHVDDFCHEAVGSRTQLLASMYQGAAAFVEQIQQARMRISPKKHPDLQ